MHVASDGWDSVSDWYDQIVGAKGHYYHETLILPNTLRLLELAPTSRLLDLACGQGVLARALPPSVSYVGVDASSALIRAAQRHAFSKAQRFLQHDLTKPLSLNESFTHAALLLSLQNISNPLAVLQTAAAHLRPQGKLVIVLNHPCFRIPRQSGWEIDEKKKLQSRRVDRYLTPLTIPIATHPGGSGGGDAAHTWSYHAPISQYTLWLKEAGFGIDLMEEWCSDKRSTGKMAKMENRARQEFPLFLAICALRRA